MPEETLQERHRRAATKWNAMTFNEQREAKEQFYSMIAYEAMQGGAHWSDLLKKNRHTIRVLV